MKRIVQHPITHMTVLGGSLVVAVVMAFAPSTWPGMMMRSFLPEWILAFAIAAFWLLFRRRWREGLLTTCGALLLMPQIGPVQGPVPTAGPSLRVAQFNVLQSNGSYTAAIGKMLLADADMISVQEVDPGWAAALREGLSASYPFQVIEPATNCYGIALFSRVPWSEAHVVRLGASPSIEAVVHINGHRTRVMAVHTSSPGSPAHFEARNRQFDLLGGHVRASPEPVVIIGDLNATPWDRDLQGFLAGTGLRTNAHASAPTFPSVAHFALIPIDHVLTPSCIGVVAQRTMHLPGSDHRGLVAEIAFKR